MANLDVLARAYFKHFNRALDLEQMIYLAERNDLPNDILARLKDMHSAAVTNRKLAERVAANAGFQPIDLYIASPDR